MIKNATGIFGKPTILLRGLKAVKLWLKMDRLLAQTVIQQKAATEKG
jgi:hypothetical protein